jgi:beta-hydroxyacyl-ACP dehydratase FabZ
MPYVLDIEAIKKMIPHRFPFLLVDRVLELDPGKTITAQKNVTHNEPFFQGHFPEFPIMPGVLQCEALAQAGGIMMHGAIPNMDQKLGVFASLNNVKFRRPVRPGDVLVLKVECQRLRQVLCVLHGTGLVDGELSVEADLSLMFVDKK